MPCIKCGELMRLSLIEPRNKNFDLLTYQCVPCDSGESFLKAMQLFATASLSSRRSLHQLQALSFYRLDISACAAWKTPPPEICDAIRKAATTAGTLISLRN
jgi:hypothetical protein